MVARRIRVSLVINAAEPVVYIDMPDGWNSWSPYRQQVFLAEAEQVAVLRAATARAEVIENQCPYTHAHTKHWCGYELCRES